MNSKTQHEMKTITEVRKAFWNAFPEFKGEFRVTKRQNAYNCTIRSAFVQYVDMLERDNEITDSLAKRVTL